ncbi:MAG TPA: helix-turn-helix domain-containing protein [Candidatus Binatia bacterium]|nr:helix-turn-helix domain-containing protein [Candidatus Binatia bacterium]
MSLNRITQLLDLLGFSALDVKVYIYIAKLGPLTNEEIASRVGIPFEQLNPVLQKLTKKRVITSMLKNHLVYSALPFENLIDEFIKSEINQAEEIRMNHQQLISAWKNLTKIKR